ncbi:unnamed protein product [Linum tenue]|uniref:Uncharacterized protein n=1 Tax=Linum tenue TaxID=586396 RepID=A0AAV0N1W4_9ROSI|nr:unnamed protein product [Linum tenue]
MAIATSTTRMLATCLLLYLCLFTGLSSCSSSTSAAGMAEGSKQGIVVNPNDLPLYYKDGYQELKNKVKVMMKTRKLLMMDVADYDETGANPRHDPRKGRGRNP